MKALSRLVVQVQHFQVRQAGLFQRRVMCGMYPQIMMESTGLTEELNMMKMMSFQALRQLMVYILHVMFVTYLIILNSQVHRLRPKHMVLPKATAIRSM